MATVCVVKEDKVIMVDGEVVKYAFTFPSNLWAIQWDGLQGHAEWTDGPNTPVTQSVIDDYILQWGAAKEAKALLKETEALEAAAVEEARVKSYTELRERAYPPITTQLDMLYWDSVNGTNLWTTLVTSIKTQYPKLV